MSSRRAPNPKPSTSKPRKVPPAPRAPMRRVVVPDSGDDDGDPPRLMFKAEVCKLIGHSFPTIWKWMRAGVFPLSFVVGVKTAWSKNEIDKWIADRPRSTFKKAGG